MLRDGSPPADPGASILTRPGVPDVQMFGPTLAIALLMDLGHEEVPLEVHATDTSTCLKIPSMVSTLSGKNLVLSPAQAPSRERAEQEPLLLRESLMRPQSDLKIKTDILHNPATFEPRINQHIERISFQK